MQDKHSAPGYRLLEHTADIGIAAWGHSLVDLFEQAFLGLKLLLVGTSPVADTQEQRVLLDADEPGELLVAWLNEVIFLFETRNLVPGKVRFEKVTNGCLRAILVGEPFTADHHRVERQVKAATYHQLQLKQEADGWTARIYLDL